MTYSSYRSAAELPDRDPNPPEAYSPDAPETPVTVRVAVSVSVSIPAYQYGDDEEGLREYIRKECGSKKAFLKLLKPSTLYPGLQPEAEVESVDDVEIIEIIER